MGYLCSFLRVMKFDFYGNLTESRKVSINKNIYRAKRKTEWFPQPSFSKLAGICKVCETPYRARNWGCGIREDGILAVCVRVWSEKTDKEGRYIHILEENAEQTTKPILTEKKESAIKADSEKLDRVYRCLLENLELTKAHGNSLLDYRLLPDTAIACYLYASFPPTIEEVRSLLKKIQAFESDLSGCAGFFTDESGEWKISLCSDGFFVPCRNIKGQIVGLQIRLDKPIGDQKFIWFSSAKKEKGSSPPNALHYAKPDLIKHSGRLIITEGLLKADICAERLHCAVAGIAGAGVSIEKARLYVSELKSEYAMIEQVSLAPDSDWSDEKKRSVRKAFINLQTALVESRIKTKVMQWDKDLGKGLDDVLNKKLLNEGR